jgi:hypothetical protein
MDDQPDFEAWAVAALKQCLDNRVASVLGGARWPAHSLLRPLSTWNAPKAFCSD